MIPKPATLTTEERHMLELVPGRIHSQESFGTVDGPGIRYVFFLQGCPLRCLFCHNPDSISPKGGTVWTARQVVRQVLRYKNYINTGGVTLSGGEPLLQTSFATALLKLLKAENIHTALDTSGCFPLDQIKEAIDLADLILLDIKALSASLSKKISGASNTHALTLLDYCEEIGKPVWIRHVLLKNYTLEEQMLNEMATFLQPYTCIKRVELLPFHKMGEHKWETLDPNLGMKYQLTDTPATSKEEAQWAKALFRNHGFIVQ